MHSLTIPKWVKKHLKLNGNYLQLIWLPVLLVEVWVRQAIGE